MGHRVVAATTIAAPIAVSPIPSLRCSGSRPRALRPIPRAAAPAPCAISIHSPATALAVQPPRISSGLAATDGGAFLGFAYWRPRRVLPDRVLLALVLALRPVRLLFFGARPRGAGSARPRPPLRRAAAGVLLGARVAMMTTLASVPARAGEAARRVARLRVSDISLS